MILNITDLFGYTIRAKDGEIGEVEDFYFDDRDWSICYLVVDTGKWLPGREVLISVEAVSQLDWDEKELPVNLTMEQIRESPELKKGQTITRESRVSLAVHYGWSLPIEFEVDQALYSAETVIGYDIYSRDDKESGRLEDLLVADLTWKIECLLVGGGSWFSGKKMLIELEWVRGVDDNDKRVMVHLLKDTILESPECDPQNAITPRYMKNLHEHYRRSDH